MVSIVNHIEIFRKAEKFFQLFKIANKRGVFYWRNFTLARFLGYQKKGKVRITQYELIASLPNVFYIACFWLIEKLRHGFTSYFPLVDLLELFFWGIVAYFMAANIWYSLSTSTYVMTTMLSIPHRINTLEDMQLLKPFWEIVNQSAASIVSVCTFLISLFVFVDYCSLLGVKSPESQWVIFGFSWSILVCFLTLCTIRQLRRMCVITSIYVVFLVGVNWFSKGNLISNGNFILITGFILALLMISHYLWVRGYAVKIVQDCLDNIKEKLRQEISSIEFNLNESNERLGNSRKTDAFEFQNINSLTNILRIKKEDFGKVSQTRFINIFPENLNISFWTIPSVAMLLLYVFLLLSK